MMQAAEQWNPGDTANQPFAPKSRRTFVQGEMGADSVVVRGISLKDSAQMRLAKHDHVVKAFQPN